METRISFTLLNVNELRAFNEFARGIEMARGAEQTVARNNDRVQLDVFGEPAGTIGGAQFVNADGTPAALDADEPPAPKRTRRTKAQIEADAAAAAAAVAAQQAAGVTNAPALAPSAPAAPIVAPTPAQAPERAVTAADLLDEPEAPPTVTLAMLRDSLQAYIKLPTGGAPRTAKLLAEYNDAKRITDVPESRWPELYNRLQAELL